MDNESRLDDPTFSRCSLGNGRWFWVTWADFESICEGHPHGTGVASSAVEAEEQATDSLTAAFGSGEFHQHSTYYARHVHRRMAVKNRASRVTENTGAAQLEFVYRDWCSDYDGKMGSSPYRVVKKTSTRVYVENRARSWEENGKAYHDVDTFVLDRQKLETEGEAYSRRQRNFFYTTPHEQRHKAPKPLPFVVFGLDAGCSEEDIHRAYRKQVKKAHPDHGGDAEQFKRLHAAYEEALKIIGA
jgi:hypothetical protein